MKSEILNRKIRREYSATVQSRYEGDDVSLLHHVGQLPQQLPVGVIDEDEDPWPHGVILHEQLRPVLQQVVPDPGQQSLQSPGPSSVRQAHSLLLNLVHQELR